MQSKLRIRAIHMFSTSAPLGVLVLLVGSDSRLVFFLVTLAHEHIMAPDY